MPLLVSLQRSVLAGQRTARYARGSFSRTGDTARSPRLHHAGRYTAVQCITLGLLESGAPPVVSPLLPSVGRRIAAESAR